MIYAVDISSILDWRYLLVFLTGIGIGSFLMLIVYLYSFILSLKKKQTYKRNPVEIDELEIEALINDSKIEFKDKNRRGKTGIFVYFKDVNLNLIKAIAEKYYPNSKYPILELSIEETIELTNYISKRIEEQLNVGVFKMTKKMTLARIRGFSNPKKKVVNDLPEDSNGVLNKVKSIGGFRRSVNWVKRVAADKVFDIFFVRFIDIVGEESYKIYSKSVFKDPKEINIDIDKLYDDINI